MHVASGSATRAVVAIITCFGDHVPVRFFRFGALTPSDSELAIARSVRYTLHEGGLGGLT